MKRNIKLAWLWVGAAAVIACSEDGENGTSNGNGEPDMGMAMDMATADDMGMGMDMGNGSLNPACTAAIRTREGMATPPSLTQVSPVVLSSSTARSRRSAGQNPKRTRAR